MASAIYERLEESMRLFRKRVLGSVARSVDPPDLTTRGDRGERVQHGEYGRCPDTGTEQNDRRIAGPQRETTPRRADLQAIADMRVIVKIRADGPVHLAFDAHPVRSSA